MDLQTIAKFFINPLIYIYIVFAVILLTSSLKLKFKFYAILFLYLISIESTSNILLNLWSVKDNKKEIKYDSIVVLAGGIDSRWHIKKQVANDLNINYDRYFKFNGAEERIFTAIEIVRGGGADNILYSKWIPSLSLDDKLYDFNSSRKMKEFSNMMGLQKKEFIIYGNKIKRTVDEVRELKLYLKRNPTEKILLITSQSHMRRALSLFRNENIYLDHYSVSKVDLIEGTISNVKSFLPNIKGLTNIQKFLYEFIGYIGYFFIGKI